MRALWLALAFLAAVSPARAQAQPATLEPIQYTFRVLDPEKHLAGVEARVPTGGRPTIELMMPVWTPGYYVLEDYAGRVRDLTVKAADGTALAVSKPRPNRWSVETKGAPYVTLSYGLLAQGRSVTSNWVDADLGVINGGAAFITLAEQARRPHDVRLEMPPTWKASISGLGAAPGAEPHHYRAPDFDTLADSPIVAGTLAVREFVVDRSTHVVADAGQYAQWNSDRSAEQIEEMVKEVRRFWGSLPFRRYVFLNVFRQGGGGLEHANSTLLTSSPKATEPTRSWLSFVAHEYFHAFNVKRIRPVELGPFDYENPPRTTSLWFSEGGTTYYGNLMLARAEPHDDRRVPRRDVLGDRLAAESPGTPAPVARAVVRRSVDEQQFRRRRERDDGQLLRQGERRFVPARRAPAPAHGRQKVDGRRDAAGDDAVRRRPRLHRRGAARDDRGSRRPRPEGLVREDDRDARRAGLRRDARLVRAALRRRGGRELGPGSPARGDRGAATAPESAADVLCSGPPSTFEVTRGMRITLLGTGTPAPSLERQSSGYLVEVAGDTLVFDHGPGAHHRLIESGRRAVDVTRAFFTHLHYDHFMDYARLVLQRWDMGAGLIDDLDVYGRAASAVCCSTMTVCSVRTSARESSNVGAGVGEVSDRASQGRSVGRSASARWRGRGGYSVATRAIPRVRNRSRANQHCR